MKLFNIDQFTRESFPLADEKGDFRSA